MVRSALIGQVRAPFDRRQRTLCDLRGHYSLDDLLAHARERCLRSYGSYLASLVNLVEALARRGSTAAASELAIICVLLKPSAPRVRARLRCLLPSSWPPVLEHRRADILKWYEGAVTRDCALAAEVIRRYGDSSRATHR